MNVTLGIRTAGERTADEIAAHSRAALDRPLVHPAELWVAVARDGAALAGAFQRAGAGVAPARRGSGGPEVLVGEGTVHLVLALAHPGVLAGSDEKRIVNRSVRPLLRALTKTGSLAHFFGRDWISVAHRPVAWAGFAHDATTRRTVFEAFVAVRAPFAGTERASFLGKPQGTLEGLAGRPVDVARLTGAIVAAYAEGHDTAILDATVDAGAGEADSGPTGGAREADPPWAATADEAIGPIGAGPDARGVFRVGGDLLVSRDALRRLEEGVVALGLGPGAPLDEGALGQLVDDTLGAPGVALDGVKSLASVRDVIARALRAPAPPAPTRARP